jgi:TolB-like protein/Tfp pilus assembly protein PilF
MKLVSELRRRNVFRMAVLYVVAAWLIMQVAEVVIGLADLPGWIGKAILAVLAVGFPVALILSWFYELTPEGVSLEKDVETAESITHVTGRRMDFIVIALLCAGLVLFAYDKWWTGPPSETSVAVLAFENMSGDPDEEHFSDGISEEILNVLAQIPELSVISRSSAFSFKGKDVSIPTLADELNVAYVLEGSVRRAGNQVRISAQLIDAHNDKHLWSETFDRVLTTRSLFAIQADIAQMVARSLQTTLAPDAVKRASTPPTDKFDAYDALLRGRIALQEGTIESMHEAIGFYQHALDVNPEFAEAYLAMAEAYTVAAEDRGFADSDARQKVEEYALKALELDESLGLAYARLASVKRDNGQLGQAEDLYRRAIHYEPGNAWILHGIGLTLRLQGRAAESVPYYDRAARLDPLSLIINESRGSLLRDLGRFEDAEEQYQNTLLIDSGFVNTHWGMGTLFWSKGQPDRAIEWFENAVQMTPDSDVFRGWLALMYLDLSQFEQAAVVIEDALNAVQADDDNDAMLANELLRIYRGQNISELPDGRRFMPRYWHGSVVDLPIRALLAGNFVQAIEEYETAMPQLRGRHPEINGHSYRAAIYLAFALKQRGEIRRATVLLDQAEAFLRNIQRLGIHGFWVSDAQIEAIRGNQAASVSLLRKAVDEGWRNLWRFYFFHDPVLETLGTDTGLQELRFRIEKEMASKLDAK